MTLVAALLPVAGARAELRTSTSPRKDAAALPSSTSLDRLTSSVALTVVSAAGDNVSELTLLATVGGHFGPAPQGYVEFTLQGKPIGEAHIAHGTATLTVAALPLGTSSLAATYKGDGNFLPSKSATVRFYKDE